MHAPSDAPNLTVFLTSPWTCRPMCMHLINALCLPIPIPMYLPYPLVFMHMHQPPLTKVYSK